MKIYIRISFMIWNKLGWSCSISLVFFFLFFFQLFFFSSPCIIFEKLVLNIWSWNILCISNLQAKQVVNFFILVRSSFMITWLRWLNRETIYIFDQKYQGKYSCMTSWLVLLIWTSILSKYVPQFSSYSYYIYDLLYTHWLAIIMF